MVFRETHADVDQDIREDWRAVLQPHYTVSRIFPGQLVGRALRPGKRPTAPWRFRRPLDLFYRQLAGTAPGTDSPGQPPGPGGGHLGDLPGEDRRGSSVRPAAPRGDRPAADAAGGPLGGQMRAELLASRRSWESRLAGKMRRVGVSALRTGSADFQGLGGIASGALLVRARTPAQLALWGMVEGARSLRPITAPGRSAKWRTGRWPRAGTSPSSCGRTGPGRLHRPRRASTAGRPSAETIAEEASRAGRSSSPGPPSTGVALGPRCAAIPAGLPAGATDPAGGHAGPDLLPPRQNFFYDSWLASPPVSLYGLSFYAASAFWLVLWCGLLLWAFTSRLRRGLRRRSTHLRRAGAIPARRRHFTRLEGECRQVDEFRQGLAHFANRWPDSAVSYQQTAVSYQPSASASPWSTARGRESLAAASGKGRTGAGFSPVHAPRCKRRGAANRNPKRKRG